MYLVMMRKMICLQIITLLKKWRPPTTVLGAESLDIEGRHMAALTWDAMFKSRRAAILADGGGGVI